MRTWIPEFLCSFGSAILIGGLIIFIYGYTDRHSSLDFWGVLTTPRYLAFHGCWLVIVGAGLVVFGVLAMRRRKGGE